MGTTLWAPVRPPSSAVRSRTRLSLLSTSSLVSSRASTTLLAPCLMLIASSLSPITSYLKVETSTWNPAVSSVSGPRLAVSSTTTPRPSSSGLTRRTSSVSSPCRTAQTSVRCSSASPSPLLRLRRRLSSPTTSILATSPLAPPTSALVCALPCTSSCPSSERSLSSSRPSPTNTTCTPAALTVSTPRPTTASSTSPTCADSAALKSTSSRICTTESRP